MFLQKYRKLISIIVAFWTTISLGLNYSWEGSFFSHFDGNSFLYFFVFVALSVFFNFMLKQKVDKRTIYFTAALAIILSTFEIVGHSFVNCHHLEFLGSKIAVIKSFIRLVGFSSILFSSLIYFYIFILPWLKNQPINIDKFSFSNKKIFLISWGVIFFCYLFYLLKFWPGSLTNDSLSQLHQIFGLREFTNHHPLIHTFTIVFFVKFALIFTDNLHYGVLLYSLFQMITMSAIFAYVVYFLTKEKLPFFFRLITLLFYALFPIFGLYSLTMWKDVPFGFFMALYVVFIFDIVVNPEKFWKNKQNIIAFVIVSFFVGLFRNNGIYVVLLSMPIIIFFNRKFIKTAVVSCVSVCAAFLLWNVLIFGILAFQKGSKKEMFSVPLQFFARLTCEKGDILSLEERETIYNFLPKPQSIIIEKYKPILSDPIKGMFNQNYYDSHKVEFFTFWIKETFKYPRVAICSFVNNSYGYYYPESNSNCLTPSGINVSPTVDKLGLQNKTFFNFSFTNFFLDMSYQHKNLPIINMIYSDGFMFWIVLIVFTYLIIKKKYKFLQLFAPIFVLWLTCLVSPVYNEYRYMFGIICSMPVVCATVFYKKDC